MFRLFVMLKKGLILPQNGRFMTGNLLFKTATLSLEGLTI